MSFYGEQQNAAVLLYRWDGMGELEQKVKLSQLNPDLLYR